MDTLFFQHSSNQIQDLEEHTVQLKSIQKVLYKKLGNNESFLDYLSFTTQKGVVGDCFSKNNIFINYKNIIDYINNNVFQQSDMKRFFTEIEAQANEVFEVFCV